MSGQILIVDDDAGCRGLVEDALGNAGFDIVEANNAGEALAVAGEEEPALVVLDVHLPGASGYEVCHRLRDTFGPDLPIVILSGERIEAYDRVAGLLLGADDYVVKPRI